MVVQHNLTAMNSNRMLGLTTKTQAKATEKLSSGYRINRAADDAAGLAISEKMRKQIRGLTQASTNAQDGISAVQTAEGALTEVHDMLQRMNELAVKAANGTQSKSDRQAIQSEINALVTEVDRVAITTKFNETYLLKGSNAGEVGKLKFSDAAGSLVGGTGNANTTSAAGCVFKSVLGTTSGKAINEGTGVINALVSDIDNKAIQTQTLSAGTTTPVVLGGTATANTNGLAAKVNTIDADTVNKVANSTSITGAVITVGNTSYYAIYSTKASVPGKDFASVSEVINVFNEYGKETSTGNEPTIKAFASLDELMAAVKQDNGADIKTISSYYEDDLANITASASRRGKMLTDATKNEIGELHGGKGTVLKIETFSDMNEAVDLSLHVGADSSSDNKINMNIAMMSARALGINGLDVSGDTATNATGAIDTIASALQMVSNQRASLGAIQNRLEHTINNLDNVVENTQSAESAIRDTDMATQMVTYSNNQILAQAGQAMLAQSNQANQGVLSLLG